jgi:hypothetical protein
LALVRWADAAQPLATDDAAILPPWTCQVEAYVRAFRHGSETWLAPACNPGGIAELSIAAARVQADEDGRSTLLQLQAKTLFVPRDDRRWSAGATFGAQRDTALPRGGSSYQTWYAKALASFYPTEVLELDFNLGQGYSHGTGRYALAAVAAQYQAAETLQVLAELYRDEPGRTKYQAGARYIAIPNRFEAYVSYGNRLGRHGGADVAVIGVRLQTPALR